MAKFFGPLEFLGGIPRRVAREEAKRRGAFRKTPKRNANAQTIADWIVGHAEPEWAIRHLRDKKLNNFFAGAKLARLIVKQHDYYPTK